MYGAGKPMKIKDRAVGHAHAPELRREPNSCLMLLQMQIERDRRVPYMQISNAGLHKMVIHRKIRQKLVAIEGKRVFCIMMTRPLA